MGYPGDTSLTAEIQDRVLTTFDQTTQLAKDGKLQEARLGCDFILRLDPHFEPARTLQGRLADATGPVETGDLLATGPAVNPEVLKTVRLSPEEIARLMKEEQNGDGQDSAPETQAAEPEEAAPEPLEETEEPPKAAKAPVGRVQIGGSVEAPGVAERTAAAAAASEEGPGDSGERIQRLLDEGQRSFDEGKYQEAIDSWSRIFLIDLDHREASQRIDQARQLKEEREREIEQIFHEGVSAHDDGRFPEARDLFEQVLERQPNHLAAREYLDRLEQEPPPAEEAPAAEEPAAAAPPPLESPPEVADPTVGAELPTAAAPRQADESYRMVARAKRQPVNRFFIIGSAAAVVVVLVAWLLISNWGRLFPNADETAGTPEAGERIKRITALHDQGELEAAVAALEEIESSDPDYLRAQRLLVGWRDELAASQEGEELTGEEAGMHDSLVAEAREAYGEGRYLAAARSFSRASSIGPLSAAEAALFDDAKRQLEPIAQQIDLYNQRQWDLVLAPLWRRLEQNRDNQDANELLVNSYFNLAVRELRRKQPAEAARYMKEAGDLAEGDDEFVRVRQFATTYASQKMDLLYDIFIDELDFRH